MSTRFAKVGGVVKDLLALPVVNINTTGSAPIVSEDVYLPGTITISGSPSFSATGQFKGRGNTTWLYADKKPYAIKLDSKASILGMPSNKSWVLLAAWFDPSMVRTQIASELGNRSGMPWSPRFRQVELYLNSVYLGVYQLGEKVTIDPARVNITSMKTTDVAGLAVTGGHLLEIDQPDVQDASSPGWTTGQGVVIAYDDPDGTITAQATYIQGFFAAFETALFGGSYTDPTVGYPAYIDVNSFIDWYLVEELLANQDARFYSSCKLYKARDTVSATGKLFMGPLWDFDISTGNYTDTGTGQFVTDPALWRSPTGYWLKGNVVWIDRMFTDAAFAAAVKARWALLKAAINTAPTLNSVIDTIANGIHYAQKRDQAAWPTAYPITPVSAIKTWITSRMAWFDTQFV